jgi:hypothetical protein
MHNIAIIAPHPDDEIIGCYSYLDMASYLDGTSYICFGSPIGKREMNTVSKTLGCEVLCLNNRDITKLPKASLYLFPDPYFETHPFHRQWGQVGETLLRTQPGLQPKEHRVVFYSVNMQAPYIFEVPQATEKLELLNTLYPEKASLWEYDHKYFLFEGYCEWGFK